MNASYSFAQAKSLVVDDLARQKTQDRKQASEPKRQKFRPSQLMIGVIGTRMEEGGAGERQPEWTIDLCRGRVGPITHL
jgi:hypothetical protein